MRIAHLLLVVGASLSLPAAAFAQASVDLSQAYAQDAAADAANRTQLLAAGSAGYSKGGFTITDEGANSIIFGGMVQFRAIGNFRDSSTNGNTNDFTWGFQERRTRLRSSGTIGDKNLSYFIQGDFARNTGAFTLLDAYAQYNWSNGVYVRWGQFKLALEREELVSDAAQLAIEASTVNTVFTQGRSQGVEVGYTGEQFRVMGDISDGTRTMNTDFNSGAEADIALTARIEAKFAGDGWDWTKDFTSFRGSKFACLGGLAAHWQSGGDTGFTIDNDFEQLTADISLEGDGWNAFAAGTWRHTDVTGASDTDDFGVVAQGGIFVADQVEIFARWDTIFADDTHGDDYSSLTGGVNYYVFPSSHAFKITGDVVYHFDDQAGSFLVNQNTGEGLLSDASDGQVVARIQVQLVY